MFWTIDRFEEDFAVLMDDNGVCRSVPRDRLPEQVRQGDLDISFDNTLCKCPKCGGNL